MISCTRASANTFVLIATIFAAATGCLDDRIQANPPASCQADEQHWGVSDPDSAASERFEQWLSDSVQAQDPQVANLYYAYYDTATGEPWMLSTMVSASVARYFLRRGDLPRAKATADAVIAWQHDGTGTSGSVLAGAIPSAIRYDGDGYSADYLYDTSDNFAVMSVLLELHAATGQSTYLEAARRIGIWIRDVMMQGQSFGVWQEPYDVPMKAVTDSGDFDNRIAIGRTLFHLSALRRLACATGDGSFATAADSSYAFLRKGQTAKGGYFDHYDPSWPPQPYSRHNFKTVGHASAVYADDSIRAALGAFWEGDREAVDAFVKWFRPERCRVHGYVSMLSGKGVFGPTDTPYFDIVSSGIYRGLLTRLGYDDADAAAFTEQTQADDGGWFWGWGEASDEPLTSDQATITGLWAVMDMSPGASR